MKKSKHYIVTHRNIYRQTQLNTLKDFGYHLAYKIDVLKTFKLTALVSRHPDSKAKMLFSMLLCECI